jgi:riboflavin kinase/FMN adenylyltransferase
VTNVGVRPTLHGGDLRRIVESHLFDFERDVYGAPIEVRFLARLRAEARFPSAEALREQIARDVRAGREYFRSAARFHSRSEPAGGAP